MNIFISATPKKGKRQIALISDYATIIANDEESQIANCPKCAVCEGADHHWLEEYDEKADEMFLECKHCPAHRPIPDDWGDEEDGL